MRKIIHIDMDAFYASVEQRDFPHLRGQPVIVGGSPDKRGVVAAASYEARRFGVRSAMPSGKAYQLCPQAHFVRARFDVYRQVSRVIRKIFFEYTDLVEPLSLDEAFLDVTYNKPGIPSATIVANRIRKQILQETRLTASAGVAPNKFIAKIASDINKPNGICVIPPKDVETFIEQLEIGKFFGIGPATERKMHELGIANGADLKRKSEFELVRHFGKSGSFFYRIARGIDHRPVLPNRTRKSVGVEETFSQDLRDHDTMLQELRLIAEENARRLDGNELSGKTITLKLRFDTFETITRARTLERYTRDVERLFEVAKTMMLDANPDPRPVRLLGISVSNLDNQPDPMSEIQLTLPFGGDF